MVTDDIIISTCLSSSALKILSQGIFLNSTVDPSSDPIRLPRSMSYPTSVASPDAVYSIGWNVPSVPTTNFFGVSVVDCIACFSGVTFCSCVWKYHAAINSPQMKATTKNAITQIIPFPFLCTGGVAGGGEPAGEGCVTAGVPS